MCGRGVWVQGVGWVLVGTRRFRGLESIGKSDQGSGGKLKMHDRSRVTQQWEFGV